MPHASMHARERSRCTALTSIPEAPECSGKPDWNAHPRNGVDFCVAFLGALLHAVARCAVGTLSIAFRVILHLRRVCAPRATSERTDSDLGQAGPATTPQHRESSGAALRAPVKRTADERQLPAWRSVKEWPAHKELRGPLTLRGSADPHAKGMRAVCRIRHGVLKLGIEQQAPTGDKSLVVVAEVPVEALAVGLQRGRTDMFTVATVYENAMFDEIYCSCHDPVARNEWIAVFRQMGVAIFDLCD